MAPTLRDIHVWPQTGFADQKWPGGDMGGATDAIDSFLRGSRRICEGVSAALAEGGLPYPTASLRLALRGPSDDGSLQFEVEFASAKDDIIGIRVPRDFHDAPTAVRNAATLDLLERILLRVGQDRGFDSEVVRRAASTVRAADFRYTRVGAWKASPDRRRRMRLAGELQGDGFFRLRLEFENRHDVDGPATSELFVGGSTAASFARCARGFRWASSSVVTGQGSSILGSSSTGLVSVDAATGMVTTADGPPAPLAVGGDGSMGSIIVREEVDDSGDVWVNYGGGGPMNDMPASYTAQIALDRDVLAGASWQGWWRLLGVTTVATVTSFVGGTTGPTVRLREADGMLRVSLKRPVAEIPGGAGGAGVARSDCVAILGAVRKRYSLAEHPSLPPVV